MRRGEIYRVARPRDDPKRFHAYVIVSRRTQVDIGDDEGLKHPSAIYCDNLVSLAKSDLTHYLGTLSAQKLVALDRALRVALALD